MIEYAGIQSLINCQFQFFSSQNVNIVKEIQKPQSIPSNNLLNSFCIYDPAAVQLFLWLSKKSQEI